MQLELFEHLQSAYKARDSCESALNNVQNNILRAMDQGKVGIHRIIDLSAAFATVGHRTLLEILHTELGIGGTAMDWFGSYLVDSRGEHSDSCLLHYGVPKGSFMKPVQSNVDGANGLRQQFQYRRFLGGGGQFASC